MMEGLGRGDGGACPMASREEERAREAADVTLSHRVEMRAQMSVHV